MAAVPVAAAVAAFSVIPPDTSLATVPTAYFGGNYQRRGDANIAMLAKARLVMIEKWEGHCWQDCLAEPSSAACLPGCAVEDDITDTLRRVKAVNPKVAGVLYLNTLLAFPFYSLIGRYKEAGALAVDSSTHQPIKIRNDNGMEGIYVYGFDTDKGVQLYVDAVKNLTATGVVDGFFGDKWGSAARPQQKSKPDGPWEICNHECGNVTAAQGQAWNAGKAAALAAATKYVGDGPYFANGDLFEGVESNLNGHWSTDSLLNKGDPRGLISDVKKHLESHTYTYVSSTGDQHWTVDPNDPASLVSQCDARCLARFLLAVEKGAFLGTNGWDPDYEKPLGDPLGPAEYTAAAGGAPATLRRNFSSGTFVLFTYNAKGDDGAGEVWWGGKPPPPSPAPTPPPVTQCGAYESTLLNDTTFSMHDVAKSTVADAAACCEACGANAECVEWAWHSAGSQAKQCHQHSGAASEKAQKGTTAGVMRR